MRAWRLSADRLDAAVDVLCEIFPDFPGSDALSPDERRRISLLLHARTVTAGLADGRVDAWGDPIVGIAVWLRRPALADPAPSAHARRSGQLDEILGPGVVRELAAFDDVLQRLRAVARPDRHAYLDMLGVLPAHRRTGIATALMGIGHAWADAIGLPCALDTDTAENVDFYRRRGYRVIAREQLPDREVVAMRRT